MLCHEGVVQQAKQSHDRKLTKIMVLNGRGL